MPPPSPSTATHPDSIAAICSSIVEQLVSDHIHIQLETLHRTHKQSLAKCPQHPRESHTLVREPGRDAFGRVIKSLSDMNAVLFMCPSCSRKIGAGGWTRHLSKCMGIGGRRPNKNGGSNLNSPMNYKDPSSSSEDETALSPTAIPHRPSLTPSYADDEDFTPTSTSSAGKKVPKKRRPKDPDKPPKPRKPRAPKNPQDSPSKTHVNRFKYAVGEMVRTVSESPLAGLGGSAMARSRSEGAPARKKPKVVDV